MGKYNEELGRQRGQQTKGSQQTNGSDLFIKSSEPFPLFRLGLDRPDVGCRGAADARAARIVSGLLDHRLQVRLRELHSIMVTLAQRSSKRATFGFFTVRHATRPMLN
jgi:hypothetical protein